MRINKNLRYQILRILAHLGGILPAAYLGWIYFSNGLGVNPVQAATQKSGDFAIALLTSSLACTPVNLLFGIPEVLRLRRTLGLYAFGYALGHFLLFAGVDYGFQLQFLTPVFTEKRYIIVGATALTILISLAVTSFKWFQRKMGKNWKRLHSLVYVAGILVVVHFSWAVKGNVTALQGDILRPLFYILLMSFLLLVRLKPIRKWIIARRTKHEQHSKGVVALEQELNPGR